MEFSTTANSGFACGFGEAATNLHFRQNLLKLAGGRAELVRASGGLLGACCRERERERSRCEYERDGCHGLWVEITGYRTNDLLE